MRQVVPVSSYTMTAKEMTIEQRNQIIELCKQHIDEQGSVRVGWAAEKILGQKAQHNILDKVAAILLQDREYVKEKANPNFNYDWNIRRNPDYKKEKWTERNPIGFEIIKGLITSIFSIIVSVILTLKIIDTKKETDDSHDNKKDSKVIPIIKETLNDTLTTDSSKRKSK